MFHSVDSIKSLNARNGWHFFDRSTMHFFNSHICSTVYGGRLFLTSEHPYTFGKGFRKYTVRLTLNDGSIETIGPFNQLTCPEAVRLARLLAPLAHEIAARFSQD